jgi:hypothetical protein
MPTSAISPATRPIRIEIMFSIAATWGLSGVLAS